MSPQTRLMSAVLTAVGLTSAIASLFVTGSLAQSFAFVALLSCGLYFGMFAQRVIDASESTSTNEIIETYGR